MKTYYGALSKEIRDLIANKPSKEGTYKDQIFKWHGEPLAVYAGLRVWEDGAKTLALRIEVIDTDEVIHSELYDCSQQVLPKQGWTIQAKGREFVITNYDILENGDEEATDTTIIRSALKAKGIRFDGLHHYYKIKYLDVETGNEFETKILAKKKAELEKSWDRFCEDLGQKSSCNVLDITQEKGEIFNFLVEDDDDEDWGYTALSFAIHVFEDGNYSKTEVMQMIADASREYANKVKKKLKSFTYADFESVVPNKVCKRHGFEKIPCVVKDSNDDHITFHVDWNHSLLKTDMKTLDVTVQCLAVYNSSIQVPAYMNREEAIQYAKEHIDEISIGELEYVSDSDELDEENCDLAFEMP